jgi:ribosomal protein S18 acetylase RimI-like enzyme
MENPEEFVLGSPVMREKIARALNFYKSHGWIQFGRRLLTYLGFVAYNRTLIFFHVDLDRINADGVDCGGLLVTTVDEVRQKPDYVDGWTRRKEDAISRLQSGSRLLRVEENGEWVSSQWVETKEAVIPYFEMRLCLPEDTAYITYVYTSLERRGRGIAYKLGRLINQYLKMDGYQHAVMVIDPSNTASIGLARKLGYREYQIVHYIRVWFLKYYRTVKYKENLQKRYFGVFKSPTGVWRAFL